MTYLLVQFSGRSAAFDIGKASDAKGEYVSKEIKLEVTLSANKL